MAFTAKTGLKAIFGLQIGIAVVLLGQDFSLVAPQIRWPTSAPAVSDPVAPGDQTRRFDPDEVRRPTMPGIPMEGAANMPKRLFFEDRPEGGTRIVGAIKEGDGPRFAEWLERQPDLPETLWLHSPGGSVGDALQIGRLIREKGINTAMDAGAVCLSACPYMLMAGPERRVHAEAKVGVHQSYYGQSTVLPAFLAVEDIQHSQAEVIRYLGEMGIGLGVMEHALSTPPDEIYILLPEELEEFSIATEITEG
ncbi:hypothetical protein [Vannielia litorea]|uniref:COG3904 family protein n=1 Tax=Vannielia litorea TaxID=1217970 RepID=UPI001C937B66|nr:hypothetical protein [Vannielia litorea]MBY6046603.1 hypothetical protein [Vannielia litorea]MBY6074017.1 hypothetical protein [Vannielia litorea]